MRDILILNFDAVWFIKSVLRFGIIGLDMQASL